MMRRDGFFLFFLSFQTSLNLRGSLVGGNHLADEIITSSKTHFSNFPNVCYDLNNILM